MADVEEPQFNSLKERIAALNRQKNFQAPPPSAGRRAAPPPPPNRAATESTITQISQNAGGVKPPTPSIPPRPTRSATDQVPPLPRRNTEHETVRGNAAPPHPGLGRTATLPPPPLPTRNSQQQISPALPSRRPSNQLAPGRRNSNSSDVSHISTISNLSLGGDGTVRRLPPTLDQAKLPPLPPTKREREAKAREDAERETADQSPALPSRSRITEPPNPSLPPRLPSRPGKSPSAVAVDRPSSTPSLPTRRLPPPPSAQQAKSALQSGFGGGKPPPIPLGSRPPTVPLASRPTTDQIDAINVRAASAPVGDSCLVCRDFSQPDAVAARHPIHALPRQDPVGYLAHVLCDPFPSATDKARAIFTWEHHNIAYDVHGFFNKCIPRGQTPEQMIFSGKAVCEGYARIFKTIAERAGLECLIVGGHGKGYGFHMPKEGDPPPLKDASGHAWNAVRIDGGEWKLLDPCWGAGHLGGNNEYNKHFNPSEFIIPNEVFGLKHYPENHRHFFREDGRVPSWEEYIMGPLGGQEPPRFFTSASEEGLSEKTVEPKAKKIRANSGEVVRFQVGKLCPHWKGEIHGKGKDRLFFIIAKGADGTKDDYIPMDTDGYWIWADVPARDLGKPGGKVMMYALDTFEGRDARGFTRERWEMRSRMERISLMGIAEWELV
ncbi:transglutaminase-like superfamily protein [Rhypophila decipiens]